MEKWALMLAQIEESEQSTETATTEPGDPVQQPGPKGFFDGIGFPLILMFVVMYFLLFRGPKKKQKKHKEMLDAVKKNDRIRTIGGILGTVVEVRENDIVVKIDEANNTKIRLARTAIAQVITEETETK